MPIRNSAPRVIKNSSDEDVPPVALFRLDNLADSSEPGASNSRGEAARMLSAAQAEAEEIRRRAREHGEAEVLAAFDQRVAAEVARQVESLLPGVRAAAEGIAQAQLICQTEWEGRVVRLAAAMAARIIRRELRADPKITVELAREALQLAAGSPQIRLEFNADDYAALRPQLDALAAQCATAGRIEIVPSPSVSRGGCRVETRFGTIDQQIETQLARLEEELC